MIAVLVLCNDRASTSAAQLDSPGALRLDVHGMLLVVVLQLIWAAGVGILMCCHAGHSFDRMKL
jgi:hypothetical protein